MMNKWIKKSFLVAIFLMLGILFSCKSPSKPDVPYTPVIPDDPIEEKEEFLITFCVLPEDEGSIAATFDAKPVTSGITKIEKGKRGASWFYSSDCLTVCLRDVEGADYKFDDTGFRLACSVR